MLILLELSAAFDETDHEVLLKRQQPLAGDGIHFEIENPGYDNGQIFIHLRCAHMLDTTGFCSVPLFNEL